MTLKLKKTLAVSVSTKKTFLLIKNLILILERLSLSSCEIGVKRLKKAQVYLDYSFGMCEKGVQVKYVIANAILEIYIRKKLINDERDILIDLKSYKLGYIYEISLFAFKGIILSVAIFDSQIYQNNGRLVFVIIAWLSVVSFIKSVYQLYLYRTS